MSQFLNNVSTHIYNTDYENILDKAKENDFVFIDPPYVNNYKFNYNIDEVLDSTFINNLYKQVKTLDSKNVKWMMTQSDTEQIKEIFKEYRIQKIKVYRMSSKTYTYELIIMNY